MPSLSSLVTSTVFGNVEDDDDDDDDEMASAAGRCRGGFVTLILFISAIVCPLISALFVVVDSKFWRNLLLAKKARASPNLANLSPRPIMMTGGRSAMGLITVSVVYKIHDAFPAPLCSLCYRPHRRKLDAWPTNKREIASFWYLALTTPTPSSLACLAQHEQRWSFGFRFPVFCFKMVFETPFLNHLSTNLADLWTIEWGFGHLWT